MVVNHCSLIVAEPVRSFSRQGEKSGWEEIEWRRSK